jgi:hypothetical protein
MSRARSLTIAIALLALSAGAVAAFTTLPDAAWNGLNKANDVSGQTVPARPADLPGSVDVQSIDLNAEDLPDAASHGVDVSTVATSDDSTPDTNRGADVSAAAKDNHGQSVASQRKPAGVPPADPGPPVDPGPPEGAGKPAGAGQPADPGQPEDPGPPDGAGKPEGVTYP